MFKKRRYSNKTCSRFDCEEPAKNMGFCNLHKARFDGRSKLDWRKYNGEHKKCQECGRALFARGLCKDHYRLEWEKGAFDGWKLKTSERTPEQKEANRRHAKAKKKLISKNEDKMVRTMEIVMAATVYEELEERFQSWKKEQDGKPKIARFATILIMRELRKMRSDDEK